MAPPKKLNVASLTMDSIMTHQVQTLNPFMSVRDAINILLAKKISGAPMVDTLGHALSIISEIDLMKFAAAGGMDHPLGSFKDKLVKPKDIIAVKRRDLFAEVFKRFLTNPVRRVLVVDDEGKVQGIVTRSDILRAFVLSETSK